MVSSGCTALQPQHRWLPTRLIEEADLALYSAKEQGRNSIVASAHESSAPGSLVVSL